MNIDFILEREQMPKKTKQYTGCIGSIEKARDFAGEC